LQKKIINVFETKATIARINIIVKTIYDRHYKSIKFLIGNIMYFRLYKNYFLSFVKSFKLLIVYFKLTLDNKDLYNRLKLNYSKIVIKLNVE